MTQRIALLLIAVLPTLLAAQAKTPTSDNDLTAKLDSIFAGINNAASPGCAVTVIANGRVIARKAYGMASLELKVPFTHQSVVRMPYSEAREFISIAAVLMEQDGILTLDDPVRQYFPQLPEWSKGVTLWDLLNHRSGFVDEWAEMLLTQAAMSNRFDLSQFLNLLYRQPASAVEPGQGYLYSNSDFGLLRLILEKASGKNLAGWLKQRVFDPLQMTSTRMQSNSLAVVPNNASVYGSIGDKEYAMQSPQKTSPGGNYFILTNADDLERWAAAHSDSTTDVAKATRRLSANVRMTPARENHYVFGQSYRKINGEMVILHEGVNEYNYLTRIPDQGVAVVTIGNLSGIGCGMENKSIARYLLNAPVPAPLRFLTKPVSIAREELTKYEGRYRWQEQADFDSYLEARKFSDVFVSDGILKMRWRSDVLVDLIPVGKDLFYTADAGVDVQFKFSPPSSGGPMGVVTTFADGWEVKMQKDTTAIWQPSKAALAGFTGRYYSKHLDFYWTIELTEAGQLVIKRPTVADTAIEPDGLDQFRFVTGSSLNGGAFDAWMLFHRGENGSLTHFTVWSPRTMHHRFDRVAPK